jgi:putative glutamine amidotransferase
MRPLIAIIGRRASTSSALRYSGTIAAEAVCDAVLRAGGEPVMLHGGDRAAVAEIPGRLTRFDGVCLPGGGDLNPARYAQPPDARSDAPDDLQDEFDLAVIRTVLGGPVAGSGAAVPALAICRGLQVLNVACGGTLRQHVADGPVPHHGGLHEVTIARGSRLGRLAGADTVTVSSAHHQAIDRLGTGVLAVQWHPEDQAAARGHDQALFDDLVARARDGALALR